VVEWLAAAGASGAGAVVSLRAHKSKVAAVTVALEHLCDALEHDRPPPSALDLIFAR